MATAAEEARKKKLIAAVCGIFVVAGLVFAWTSRKPTVKTVTPVAIEPTDEPIDLDVGPKKVREQRERPTDRNRESSKPAEASKRTKKKQEKIPKPAPRAGLP